MYLKCSLNSVTVSQNIEATGHLSQLHFFQFYFTRVSATGVVKQYVKIRAADSPRLLGDQHAITLVDSPKLITLPIVRDRILVSSQKSFGEISWREDARERTNILGSRRLGRGYDRFPLAAREPGISWKWRRRKLRGAAELEVFLGPRWDRLRHERTIEGKEEKGNVRQRNGNLMNIGDERGRGTLKETEIAVVFYGLRKWVITCYAGFFNCETCEPWSADRITRLSLIFTGFWN